MKKDIFVIGHKNPDTDSICSAIAYAHLKNQLSKGQENYVPMRAGQISAETSFVLNYFHHEAPGYINDVRSQVKDAELDESICVSKDMSLKNAWNLLKENHLSTLTVVNEQKHMEGLITVGDIARSFMGVYDNQILSNAKTPYKNIVETVEGELLVGDIDQCVEHGKVLIAAANPDLMEEYIEDGDIVILGDRYETQLCAIEMNASCIIVCVGAYVSEGIKKLAEEKGCAIIKTNYDTFIAARLMNQSIPISFFMVKEGLISFKPEEFIEDVRKVMATKRHRDFPVINHRDEFVGLLSRHSLIDMVKKQLILVDHNEKNQAVDGIEDAEILELIDHHKLGYVETLKPVYFRAQPVGCTGTIVYLIYKEKGVEIPADIAGLLCSAIVSDTLMYRSPTCTALDIMAADALAKISGIEIESYAMEMFGAGSNLKSKSAEEIFYQDFKKFNAGSRKYGVGQITSINHEELDEIREKMIDYMQTAGEKHGVGMVFFMMTDILKESTELLCMGHGAYEAAVEAFDVEGDGTAIYLEGVVSRKKQLIPKLMAVLQN